MPFERLRIIIGNVRLGAGAPPIGIPFFWPSAAMPNAVMPEWSDMVFLKWNGATFSASTYPKLALVIPSLTLTESRGEFPRIWDDGRGVDSGRALLSAQGDAIRNMAGTISVLNDGGTASGLSAYGGVFSGSGPNLPPISAPAGSSATRPSSVKFDPSTIVPTAGENRPRNIAFNFLVRAK
ncbi:phage tail protein [Citrobacter sp. RHBSTW-00127]|uniref:phage tail protein n=1 Tax=Citrobacter sp. RHBSTW-00127 TaxID=2742636 RepID=UPI0015E93470|nr:phage tail protein [Citrobacter sp. RHBSTW-00127]QLZ40624.1 phage tail protein [Citrobacter sp. RHBSTW-00127]